MTTTRSIPTSQKFIWNSIGSVMLSVVSVVSVDIDVSVWAWDLSNIFPLIIKKAKVSIRKRKIIKYTFCFVVFELQYSCSLFT